MQDSEESYTFMAEERNREDTLDPWNEKMDEKARDDIAVEDM